MGGVAAHSWASATTDSPLLSRSAMCSGNTCARASAPVSRTGPAVCAAAARPTEPGLMHGPCCRADLLSALRSAQRAPLRRVPEPLVARSNLFSQAPTGPAGGRPRAGGERFLPCAIVALACILPHLVQQLIRLHRLDLRQPPVPQPQLRLDPRHQLRAARRGLLSILHERLTRIQL